MAKELGVTRSSLAILRKRAPGIAWGKIGKRIVWYTDGKEWLEQMLEIPPEQEELSYPKNEKAVRCVSRPVERWNWQHAPNKNWVKVDMDWDGNNCQWVWCRNSAKIRYGTTLVIRWNPRDERWEVAE